MKTSARSNKGSRMIRLLALLSALLVTVCCSKGGDPFENEIVLRTGSHLGEVKKLNPWDKALFVNNLIPLMHVKLVSYSKSFDTVPMLAEKWDVSTDGRSITFHIRRNAKWHDGHPVTAGDVEFSLMLCRKHEKWSRLNEFIEDVEVIDRHTVKMVLNKSTAFYLLSSWLPTTTIILPKHIWGHIDKPREYNSSKALVGCGPFIFDKYDRVSQTVNLKANHDYFGGKPSVDRIVWKQFKSFDTMFMSLLKGDIDAVLEYHSPIPRSYIIGHMSPDVQFLCAPDMGVPADLLFNCRKPPMSERRFREAVACSIDYKEIMKVVAGEEADAPGRGFVPPSYPFYKPGLPAHGTDRGRAEKLLRELGFVKSEDGFLQDAEKRRLSLELLVQQGARFPYLVQTAELVGRHLREVGIEAQVAVYETALADKKLFGERTYDICVGRFMPLDILAGCGTLLFVDSPGNMGTCGDRRLVALSERFHTAKTTEEMRGAAWALQDYYAHELPGVALYHAAACFACRTDRFKGWTVMSCGIANHLSWFSIRPVGG
jgi:peptide/nickel transport system substrate-binding protein